MPHIRWFAFGLLAAGRLLLGSGAPNLLTNSSFEADVNNDGSPDGFRAASQYRLTTDRAHTGKQCVRFRSEGPLRWRYLSQNVRGEPNHLYTLRVWAHNEDVQDLIFTWSEKPNLGLWRPERVRIGPSKEWKEHTISFKTGEDAEFSVGVGVTGNHRGPATAYLDDFWLGDYIPGPTSDGRPVSGEAFEPRPMERIRSWPTDGASVSLNPPTFKWIDQKADSYVVSWSRDPDLENAQMASGIELRLYTPSRALEPGVWYWRHACTFGDRRSLWSRAKKFVVPEDAPQLPMPTRADLKAKIPRSHPRAFFAGKWLESARGLATTGLEPDLKHRQKRAAKAATAPLPDEPVKVNKSDWSPKQVSKFLSVHATASRVCARATQAAFVYLMTGDRVIGDDAKRCALHMSRWDPEGATNVRYSDYAAFYTLLALALPYDWAHDQFTEDERKQVEAAISVRGQMMYDCFQRGSRIDVRPYHSHGWLNVRKLSIAALAVAHEVPEAVDWLQWAAQLHVGLFPAWGGDDGAWAQGVAYYDGSYTLEVNWFAHLLKESAGLDLYQKPWYRSTPRFLLYSCPAYGYACEFGDGAPGKRASNQFRASMRNFASACEDRYAAWYAATGDDKWGGWASFLNFLREPAPVEPKPPLGLPLSRWFRDVGWVVMHTDLTGVDDVMFAMKSSSYGSFNHSHCDQNSFMLHAWGERLAVDTGYYDYYGSKHHNGWTVQTVAHNAILVDGQGQPRSMAAGGFIRDHVPGGGLGYAAGDATPAYGGRLSRWIRHALFVRPGCVLVCDDLASDRPREFTWLLHALDRMEVDREGRRVQIRRSTATLDADFLTPAALTFEQTDKFTHESSKPWPNQWHLRATPPAPSTTQQFLVALAPRRSEATSSASKLPGKGWLGARLQQGHTTTTAIFRTGTKRGNIGPAELRADGLAAAATIDASGRLRAALLSQGTVLSLGDRATIQCERTASVSVDVHAKGAYVTVRTETPQQVMVRLPAKPVVAEAEDWQWSEDGMLVLSCSPGASDVHCLFQQVKPVEPPSMIVIDGKGKRTEARRLEITQAWPKGKTYAFGCGIEMPPGRYRVEARPASALSAISVRVGRELMRDLSKPTEVVISGKPEVVIESDGLGTMPVRELIFQSAGEPASVRTDPRTRQSCPTAVLVEAETFVTGSSSRLAKRTEKYVGISGEIVWGWSDAGSRIAWQVELPRGGTYEVMIRGTTDFGRTVGDFSIDGGFPHPALKQIVYPQTGGWGYAEGDWQSFLLCDEAGAPLRLALTPGPHRIKMTCIEGGLNLDYVLLVPITDGG